MMDKIPVALQRTIDSINGLDIPATQKHKRIATSTADYWSAYHLWQQWSGHEDKGLQPAKNPPPMPPVMPPKRVINEDITLANKGKVMGGGGGSGFCSEGGKGGSGFKASKADVNAQRIKDNDESMRGFYAMWGSL